MLLVNILIVIFVCLLVYQTFLALFPNKLMEGLENETSSETKSKEYQPYNVSDPSNALILAQQNAGNIEVLKGRIDGFDGVKERLNAMEQNIDSMQVQMDQLVQQQADYAAEIAGTTPPVITGTEEEEDVENVV
jgi:hypothetical protein